MFHRFFGSNDKDETTVVERPAPPPPSDGAGDTATVRRIVAKLEAMPPEKARFLAAAAYTLARAANADLDISDDETAAIERELQGHESIDEATAVLVTEMAKLQAKTVGGTEDFVVTREFKALADHDQRLVVLRACFAVDGGQRHDLRRGDGHRQRDRGASSTSTRRSSTPSAPTSTSSCRRSSRSGASPRRPRRAGLDEAVDARGHPRRRPLAPGGDRQPVDPPRRSRIHGRDRR